MRADGGQSGGLAQVVIVNTTDRGGGAESLAMAALDGFQSLGTETWMAVGAKHTDHPRVVPLWASSHVDYRPHAPAWRQRGVQLRRQFDARLGREDFVHPYTRYLLQVAGFRPDLVLCHNLHGGYFDLTALPWLSREAPVVLSLADSWLFTGHCAQPLGCPRWATGCGHCPDLAIPPAIRRDATASNWRRKRRMFEASRLFAVSPSRWLQARAQSSILASGVEEWKVVPYGVDVSTFTPASRGEARRRAGVPDGGAVLVYVANLGPNNPYKDFATIRAAVGELARRRRGPLEVLVVGQQRPLERLSDDAVIRYLPYCESASRLADLYRAADLYVHAAPEESFGLTTAEALACGTPAVVAAGGGIAEVVDHGRTGLLTPVGDSGAMAEAIAGLLDDPAGRSRMGEEAARQARARFDRDRMVAELHAWCAEVAAGWRQ